MIGLLLSSDNISETDNNANTLLYISIDNPRLNFKDLLSNEKIASKIPNLNISDLLSKMNTIFTIILFIIIINNVTITTVSRYF